MLRFWAGIAPDPSRESLTLSRVEFHRTACKLMIKILRRTKKYIFCRFDPKKVGIILIRSHRMAVAALAVVIFACDGLRGKEVSAPDSAVRQCLF